MPTQNSLESHKCKDLAQMAKQQGIPGWHSMRKAQLISALEKVLENGAGLPNGSNGKSANGKLANGKSVNGKSVNGSSKAKQSAQPRNEAGIRRIQAAQSRRETLRDLSTDVVKIGRKKRVPEKDRIVLLVRDSYWLQAYWELTDQSVQRAKAALGAYWHGAKPVIRVYQAEKGMMPSTADQQFRTIEIHGGVNHWYIDVKNPPHSFRAEIGYLTTGGHFHSLARSNSVTTPRPSSREMLDGHWADVLEDADRVYAMSGGFDQGTHQGGELQQLFEERLCRPMGSPMVTRFGSGAEGAGNPQREMTLDVEAEMIVFGMTDSDAYVTMGGEPIPLSKDGSFRVRMAMPDKRQVIPVVAGRSDGVEEQTVVLAVERNTKVLERRRREITS